MLGHSLFYFKIRLSSLQPDTRCRCCGYLCHSGWVCQSISSRKQEPSSRQNRGLSCYSQRQHDAQVPPVLPNNYSSCLEFRTNSCCQPTCGKENGGFEMLPFHATSQRLVSCSVYRCRSSVPTSSRLTWSPRHAPQPGSHGLKFVPLLQLHYQEVSGVCMYVFI